MVPPPEGPASIAAQLARSREYPPARVHAFAGGRQSGFPRFATMSVARDGSLPPYRCHVAAVAGRVACLGPAPPGASAGAAAALGVLLLALCLAVVR